MSKALRICIALVVGQLDDMTDARHVDSLFRRFEALRRIEPGPVLDLSEIELDQQNGGTVLHDVHQQNGGTVLHGVH